MTRRFPQGIHTQKIPLYQNWGVNPMPKPCLTPMCGNLAMVRKSRCRECERSYRAVRYNHPAYKALPRPTGMCELRLPGCTGMATTLDHIDGNAKNHNPSNIQNACLHCNSKKQNKKL